MEETFKESFLATSNTKLAAIYKFFELKLPRHNPAIVAEIFQWDDLKRGIKVARPPRRVIWKFQADSKAREITKAFEGKDAHVRFQDALEALDIPMQEKERLEALHSNSIAQAGREILEVREFLVSVLKGVPDQAMWQVIEKDGRVKSIFAKAASPETKAKFFERDL